MTILVIVGAVLGYLVLGVILVGVFDRERIPGDRGDYVCSGALVFLWLALAIPVLFGWLVDKIDHRKDEGQQ